MKNGVDEWLDLCRRKTYRPQPRAFSPGAFAFTFYGLGREVQVYDQGNSSQKSHEMVRMRASPAVMAAPSSTLIRSLPIRRSHAD